MSATATMRVSVYAEALRDVDDADGSRVFLHIEQVKDAEGQDLPFKHHAIRILIGDRVIHSDHGRTKKDDDTAAVTFWFSTDDERQKLVRIFEQAIGELNKPEATY